MNEAHIQRIANELKVQPRQVLATARLFAEGATVPFIARYRKEATGSLDEGWDAADELKPVDRLVSKNLSPHEAAAQKELAAMVQSALSCVAGVPSGDACACCVRIVDCLRASAPFWKRGQTAVGARWAEARASDDQAADRWRQEKSDAA